MSQTTRQLSPRQRFKSQKRGRAYKGWISFQSSVSKIHQVPPSTSSAVPLIGHWGQLQLAGILWCLNFFSILECIVRCRNYGSTKRPVTLLTAFSRLIHPYQCPGDRGSWCNSCFCQNFVERLWNPQQSTWLGLEPWFVQQCSSLNTYHFYYLHNDSVGKADRALRSSQCTHVIAKQFTILRTCRIGPSLPKLLGIIHVLAKA